MKFRRLIAGVVAVGMMLSVAACSKKDEKKEIKYYSEDEFVAIAKDELGLTEDNMRFLDAADENSDHDIYFQYNTAIAIAQYYPTADIAREHFEAYQDEASVEDDTPGTLADNYMTIDGDLTITDDDGSSITNTLYQAMYLSDNVIIQVFAQDGSDDASRGYVDTVIAAFDFPSIK